MDFDYIKMIHLTFLSGLRVTSYSLDTRMGYLEFTLLQKSRFPGMTECCHGQQKITGQYLCIPQREDRSEKYTQLKPNKIIFWYAVVKMAAYLPTRSTKPWIVYIKKQWMKRCVKYALLAID